MWFKRKCKNHVYESTGTYENIFGAETYNLMCINCLKKKKVYSKDKKRF